MIRLGRCIYKAKKHSLAAKSSLRSHTEQDGG